METVSIFTCLLLEIGNTISNLFGGGKTEDTGEVSPEGSPEETVPAEVLCTVFVHAAVCRCVMY